MGIGREDLITRACYIFSENRYPLFGIMLYCTSSRADKR
jgi:hypothetical protein